MSQLEGVRGRDLTSDLTEIARRARSLDEVLRSGRTSSPDTADPEGAAQALARWRFAFCKGNTEAFVRRLRWDKIETERIGDILARGLATEPETLPDWIRPLADVLGGLASSSSIGREGGLAHRLTAEADAHGLPFADVWVPFVCYADARLAHVADLTLRRISPDARFDLAQQLLTQLVRAAELALFEQFADLREKLRQTAGDPADAAAGAHAYEQFIDALLAGALISFFRRYSALARQVSTLIETWVSASAEMLGRLEWDRGEIQAHLCDGRSLGPLTGIEGWLSDRHHGGRRVLRLAFGSGIRIMYKPRPVAIDVAYNRFLGWLRKEGLDPAPATVRILQRDTHGWIEFVPQTAATNAEAAREYHRQAGALLCLAHLLGGSDLHMDNVVAGPAGPVLVDVESFVQPERVDPGDGGKEQDGTTGAANAGAARDAGGAGGADNTGAARAAASSCLSTGLLTFLKVDPDGRIYDIGGFLGTGGHLATRQDRQWTGVNTDAMEFRYGMRTAEQQKNLLFLEQQPQSAESYSAEIQEGFAAAYRFLCERREALAAPQGPLSWFAGLPARHLIRDSEAYAQVLHSLLTPKFQLLGIHQGIASDLLNRVFCGRQSAPAVWPATAEERHSLEGLDVPYFSVVTDQPGLWARERELIPDFFTRSGIDIVRARLAGMDESDLEHQRRCIRAVLPARKDQFGGAPASPADIPEPAGSDPCLRAAKSIARGIEKYIDTGPDGFLRIDRPASAEGQDPLDPVHDYLYDGSSGVALFFAALALVGEDSSDRQVAEGLARALLQRIGGLGARSDLSLGACNGLGGLIYSLTAVGSLLGMEECTVEALRLARRVDDEAIRADRRLDVEGGVAGAILCLLTLHGLTAERWILESAVRCGGRLLAEATPAESGGAAWVGQDGVMRAGFAHGAAGVIYALSRLYEVTRFDPLLEAIRDGLQFERGVYSRRYRNWPVLAVEPDGKSTRRVLMNAWCHGAPGIALSRLGVLRILDDPRVKADLEAAVATTAEMGLGEIDHLCCGNMGRVETLLHCGVALEEPGFVRAAGVRTAMLLRRQFETGRFRLYSPEADPGTFEPGFFRGLSGIGYELLRLSDPSRLPSVLSFEGTGL